MDFDLFPSQDMDGCCMDGMMNWLSTGSTLWNDIPFCDNILDDENCLVPPVQTEHSYSMNDNDGLFSTDQDLDQEAAMVLVNPNLALMPDSPLPSWKTEEPSELSNLPSWKTEESSELSPLPYWKAEESSDMLLSTVKTEMCDSPMKEDDEDLSSLQSSDSTDFQVDDIAPQPQQSPTFILTYRSNSKLSSRQPTIIVTKMHQPLKTRMLLNKNHDQISNQDQKQTTIHNYSPETLSIKTEDAGLPPSPPNSDTEVTLSPQKTSSKSFGHNVLSDFRFNHHDNGKSLVRSMSTNVPSSDVLIITEEEKRTLIAEGYPVPTKLPLSKQEEKALKKIQRKIKNKMSAQESRKKKKDYLENLEMKSKKSEAENTQLRQKVEHLEHDNRKLVSELQKLRQIIGSYSVQKSTIVMAVVFFFAVCFGIWSPSTFPTYSTNSLPTDVLPASISSILDVNDYITPSKQSRILLSVADEQDLDFKSTSQNALFDWFSSLLVCKPEQHDSETTHVTLFVEDNVGFAQNSDLRNETWKPVGYSEPQTNINLTYTTDFNSVLV